MSEKRKSGRGKIVTVRRNQPLYETVQLLVAFCGERFARRVRLLWVRCTAAYLAFAYSKILAQEHLARGILADTVKQNRKDNLAELLKDDVVMARMAHREAQQDLRQCERCRRELWRQVRALMPRDQSAALLEIRRRTIIDLDSAAAEWRSIEQWAAQEVASPRVDEFDDVFPLGSPE
ncbi:MAG: hypothetical protein NTY65_16250 [Planctomycetota bacterium]|nr:hypothetical protein [Planctomycetota bacterium]